MEVTLTTDNFESEVLQSPVPVLVDFWAEWCMPCKMVAPVLAEIATEYEGKAKIGKINVDEQSDLAAQFNIVSIPTLLLFKDGEVIQQQVGAAPKEQLEVLLRTALTD